MISALSCSCTESCDDYANHNKLLRELYVDTGMSGGGTTVDDLPSASSPVGVSREGLRNQKDTEEWQPGECPLGDEG